MWSARSVICLMSSFEIYCAIGICCNKHILRFYHESLTRHDIKLMVAHGSPRCAVLSCWGAPTQKKSLFLLLLLLFFQKKYIKFKVALRPRLGLKPMVISVSNHGRRVVKPGTPRSTPCVSLVHSKHLTWWHRPTQAESTKRKSRPTLVIKKSNRGPFMV